MRFVPKLLFANQLATRSVAVVHDAVHVCPAFELPLPVGNGGQRSDHQEGPPYTLLLVQVAAEGDTLHSLAKPHLVGEDAVAPLPQEGAKG